MLGSQKSRNHYSVQNLKPIRSSAQFQELTQALGADYRQLKRQKAKSELRMLEPLDPRYKIQQTPSLRDSDIKMLIERYPVDKSVCQQNYIQEHLKEI